MLAVDFDKDFIDVERVAISSVLSLQSTCIDGTEFDAPEADRFATDGDASLGQNIFDISVAQIESVVQPDSIRNDIWRESVSLVSTHPPILSILESLLVITLVGPPTVVKTLDRVCRARPVDIRSE